MIRSIKPKTILILGSGALQIGQAGEFDYSGSQAIKALKEDGIFTVLINPNIATIQTSEHLADKVYFLPVNVSFVEQIIIKEKPDGILLGFGGQTALNVGVQLYEQGILEKYNVKVLGTSVETIKDTEDRQLFADKVTEVGLKVARSITAATTDEALQAAEKIGYPVMCRVAYALGGLGSGIVQNKEELKEKTDRAFAFTNQVLIEECLYGWKEVEYEIVRDAYDNCITTCSMENFDPMGIHTGDSIVVAPVQTLTAKEHFNLRAIGLKLIRHLGVVGECNIQYALDPRSGDYRIIEVNARLSRSSALASKATGYPLAFVATKLALGYSLNEVENIITKETSACFEPALDYITLKFPRWDLQKFEQVNKVLGTEMKSVGEVMAIGRSFEEVLQKAVRMLDIGMSGLVEDSLQFLDLDKEISQPTDKRIFAIARALKQGYTVDRIHELSKIDRWFLHKLKNIVDLDNSLKNFTLETLPLDVLKTVKQAGFSDKQIAEVIGCASEQVRAKRKELGVLPVVKQIDTLAAEYPAKTNYLYLTYHGQENDVMPSTEKQVIVLGSGPYRIGSSVEFDWCGVNSLMTLQKCGYKTIMINCNPETVSTDYDVSDQLYFEELSLEKILDIYEWQKPIGVVVSMGGQVPNNLALKLHKAGVNILGTSPMQIDNAESRQKFSQILDGLGIDQPEWKELTDLASAKEFAERVGYPVLVRPSYVLSGAAMSISYSKDDLELFLKKAVDINKEHSVVISKFITKAREIELDGVANNGELFCYAISEHLENAGVHSGDATLVFPPQKTYLETTRRIKKIAKEVAKALEITGPFNMQLIAKDNDIKVIECNLRASRSFPFVSKVLKINFVDIATRLMMGQSVPKLSRSSFDLDYVGVKASQFSFTRLKGSDPVTRVEMSSTGEVACLGDNLNEAFLKSIISTGFNVEPKSVLLSIGSADKKLAFLEEARALQDMGIKIYATKGTGTFLQKNNIQTEILEWAESSQPSVMSYLSDKMIDLVVAIPNNTEKVGISNGYLARRKAIDQNISLITNLEFARRYVKAISKFKMSDLKIKSWDEYV
ncbi:MAG: carbamoyl-phosphate synthase (glutamine-hydrolyzing) large subunit [Candidatus Magasanikbacteria bacterium]|nr:carbamoyl-phosphate synthase (glutamine-hydrolyzing) large subunit [Candidatus Magasanikbacteria bacterium]